MMTKRLSFGFIVLSTVAALRAEDAVEVKWEAESTTNTSLSTQGFASPQGAEQAAMLSGGQWLNGRYDKSGPFAEYVVTVPKTGRYQLFARKYWQHGPFRWRFDAGTWYQIKEAKLLDSVTWRPYCCANWVKLGDLDMTSGAHTFRVELIKDPAYAFCSAYGLDAFLLTTQPYLGCAVTADEPPEYREVGTLKTGGNLDENGITLEADQREFGCCIPRTMALLAGSNPTNRPQIRILLYGQSIVASPNVQAPILAFLKQRYPYARIVCENRAIGGYTAPTLCRTSWQDLYPFYPDLVVFHVYGGEDDGTLEEIFRNLRRFTTAEVITWTDHVDALHSLDASRDKAEAYRRKLARQYGVELVEARTLWKDYLRIQQVPEQALLADKQIHLNAQGGELLAQMLARHFKVNAAAPTNWQARIQTVDLRRPHHGLSYERDSWTMHPNGLLSNGTKPLRFAFVGNKVDLLPLAVGAKPGTARITLDGQAPSTLSASYAASRSSLAPGSWWPTVTRVKLGPKPVAETWTLAFHDVAPDGKQYAFDLHGSVTGPDGSGKAGEDFASPSGRISIAAGDLAIANVQTITRKPLPATFSATWTVYSMSRDVWTAKSGTNDVQSVPETLVQLWDPGRHEIEIIPDGNGPVGVQALVVHNRQADER